MYIENAIILTPVANGWIVTMPEKNTQDNPFNPEQFTDIIRNVKDVMNEEDGDLSKIIKDAVKKEEQKTLSPVQVKYNVHVFSTFTEVLAFLKYFICESEEQEA